MNLFIQISKYVFIILMLLYALEAYTCIGQKSARKRNRKLAGLTRIMYIFVTLGFVIVFLNQKKIQLLMLMAGIWIYFGVTQKLYRKLYPKSSMLLVNNMLMLLSVGFVMISRINLSEGIKQFIIAAGSTVIALAVPVIIRKLKVLAKLKVLYAILGLLALGVVLMLATRSGGATLSITVGGITIQFSELVKITFVFYLASRLARDASFRSIVIASVVAALHVGILVLSTDLGTALVFFVTYVVLIYVASRRWQYPVAGIGAGCVAAVAAYHLFAHVRQRVTAWKDPFAVYDTSGYQIAQGLFAIAAGGWFGVGLCQGKPNSIPVATKDFMFAAICEEFGGVFCIAMLLVCMCLFILIVNISMLIHNRFYKLVALGLGTEYAFQVFLTVGGVTKFIPMTGITLPLVSYGGSSVASTIIMLAIIQGLYILREDEGEELLEIQRKRSGGYAAGNRQ
ncbi:MAG: FtsW/RodA/SpoVE family cell cycle protein [Eubacteriales bacterium]|jgi:cell division protein FtsW (lipid II flippase)